MIGWAEECNRVSFFGVTGTGEESLLAMDIMQLFREVAEWRMWWGEGGARLA